MPPLPKTCLVTVGATAPFTLLLAASLSKSFLSALARHGYTRLLLQCGTELDAFAAAVEAQRPTAAELGVQISAFGFVRDLGVTMAECIEKTGVRGRGCVIGHAGSGTIIDALAIGTRLIVVPNTALKDNHQMETAEEFARQGMVVWGDVSALVKALDYSESTPILPVTAEEAVEEKGSLALTDVLGALALQAADPKEFSRQVRNEENYGR